MTTIEGWAFFPAVVEPVYQAVNPIDRLSELLRDKLDSRKVRIRAAIPAFVVRRDPFAFCSPDLAVILLADMIEEDGFLHSAPELVIEVLSPSNGRFSRKAKLEGYESMCVPEVWVLSPEAETVEILQLEDGRFRTTSVLRQGLLAPKLFPEAEIDVAAVWER